MTQAVAPGLARASAARAYLRAHRRARRASPFAVYATVVVALVFGAIGEPVLATIVGGGVTATTVASLGPAGLALVLVGALRFGVWQGPVGFSTADVCLLLTAPVSTAALVRPKLDGALALGGLAGAMLGALLALLSAGGIPALGVARTLGAVVGMAAVAVVAVAVSWLIEVAPGAARAVARGGAWLALGAVVPLVGFTASTVRVVVGWSGPWGWALASLDGRAGWPLALGLVVLAALGSVVVARRRVGAARPDAFLARAQTRSGMAMAAFTLDYRGAALARRAGATAHRIDREDGGRAARLARMLKPPSRPGAALPWRDARALIRAPGCAGWAALLAAAGIVEVATHPGRGLPAFAGALALYWAAALLCEPLRAEVDRTDRGRVLLSLPFARVLFGHCVVPAAVLLVTGALTLAGLAGAGVITAAAAVGLAPTLLVAAVALAVLAAALATRRGGRVDPDLLTRLLALDPSNPMALMAVVWLAPWLLVDAAVLTAAAAICGHAAAAPGPVTTATGMTALAAAALWSVARRADAPDA